MTYANGVDLRLLRVKLRRQSVILVIVVLPLHTNTVSLFSGLVRHFPTVAGVRVTSAVFTAMHILVARHLEDGAKRLDLGLNSAVLHIFVSNVNSYQIIIIIGKKGESIHYIVWRMWFI